MGATTTNAVDDRTQLTQMVYELGRCLDEHAFDQLADLFADDATATTPGGTAHGREAVVAQATRNHVPYAALQHLMTNVLVDIDGDEATIRANLLGVFVGEQSQPALAMGGVYRIRAARTPDGWRFTHLQVTPVWRASN